MGVILLGVGAASVFAIIQYQAHRPHRQFRVALEALERGDIFVVSNAADALREYPGYESHANLLLGATFLRRGRPQSALSLFAELNPQGEIRTPAMLLTGECLYTLGRLAEARVVMTRLVQEEPDLPNAHRWLGAIYYDLGANDLAIGHLEKLIELKPDDFSPHRLLGVMYRDFEQSDQAILHYRKALDLIPPATIANEIRVELAKSLIHEREYASALEVLEKAPSNVNTLVLQGECLWTLGQRNRADQVLSQARSLDQNDRDLLFLQSRLQVSDGHTAKAIDLLKRILKLDQHDPEARYQLARLFQQAGRVEEYKSEIARWEQSKKLFDKLTELNIKAVRNPEDADIRQQLSDVCRKLGKHDLATMWSRAAEACRQGGTVQPQKTQNPVTAPIQ
jgi:Flp pilus assembly protein TadD